MNETKAHWIPSCICAAGRGAGTRSPPRSGLASSCAESHQTSLIHDASAGDHAPERPKAAAIGVGANLWATARFILYLLELKLGLSGNALKSRQVKAVPVMLVPELETGLLVFVVLLLEPVMPVLMRLVEVVALKPAGLDTPRQHGFANRRGLGVYWLSLAWLGGTAPQRPSKVNRFGLFEARLDIIYKPG